jgi:DNA-binding XRE family transcriptional regulator
MQVRTKKHPTEERRRVPLTLMVRPANVEKIKRLAADIDIDGEGDGDDGYVTADEFFARHFAGRTRGSVSLRGLRYREGLTQQQLAERTGISRRHISEMETGKRPVGKQSARKLAEILGTDYRMLL